MPVLDSPASAQRYLPDPEVLSPNQNLLPLTAKANAQGHLEVGGCDVAELVARYGSPLYLLDEQTLRTACQQYRTAFVDNYPGSSQVIFASKAWSCLAVCAIIAREGLGFDVVSSGELLTALTALEQLQIPNPEARIYFHGNNKSRQELQSAIATRVTVVVDNWLELKILAELATPEQPVRIMLRLTPGIECHTHEYIRTGHLDSKFGFDPNQMRDVFQFITEQPALNCSGLHAHIGSQIFEQQPHQDLGEVMIGWLVAARDYGLNITEVNVGGGLGIRYLEADDPPSIAEWVRTVCESVKIACDKRQLPLPKIIAEPGRSLVGPAGITAYTVGSRKEIPELDRIYLSVDGGMSDNPRPITYQSQYRVAIANRLTAPLIETVTVAGKHCESGDIVVSAAEVPKTESGDVLIVMATGAYNYSMASNYNRLPRPAALLLVEGESHLILQRETDADLLRYDCLPSRLLPAN
ncbi:MAG: diaminopimelate decarboxylase [Cyanobacteria bacterium P01_H01_bin.15]